ncbi:MAG TPA: hypothetical protein VEW07_03510 [Solirubrobacterales bacterium]|nr:hypothetical protein [Solirubrobacterales bacterium]
MLALERKEIGRFEEFTLPNGEVIYKEVRGDNHYYWGEIKPNRAANGGYSAVRNSHRPGASGIAKYLDPESDPLLHWAARLERVGIASLASAALAVEGDLTWLGDPRQIERALEEGKLRWSDVRNQRADEGTAVHRDITFELAQGRQAPSLAGLSDEGRGYGQAKMKWWRERQPEPIAAEQVTACHSKRYAGTFDLLAMLDLASPDLPPIPEGVEIPSRGQVPVLIDDKTRQKPRTYKSDHVQLRLYKTANTECEIGESALELIVVLLPDGNYHEAWAVATDADANSALLASQSGKHLDKRMRASAKAAKELMPV